MQKNTGKIAADANTAKYCILYGDLSNIIFGPHKGSRIILIDLQSSV